MTSTLEMEPFLKIAKHFASVGALALAVLQVKKIISKGMFDGLCDITENRLYPRKEADSSKSWTSRRATPKNNFSYIKFTELRL